MNAAAVLAEARRWIGTPYRHRASCAGAGTDCLGLVRGIYRALHGREPEIVPPYAPDWGAGPDDTLIQAARRHLLEIEIDEAGAGAVVLFRLPGHRTASHAGILNGGGGMIHAQSNRAVCETPIGSWWRRRMVAAFVFPDAPVI